MAVHPNKIYFSKHLNLILGKLDRNRLRVLKGLDPEALHDFRVSLRRLRTCLRLMEGCYPSRILQPVLRFLKKNAQDTNNLRDREVFEALWKGLQPLPHPSPGLQAWLLTQVEIRRLREKEVADSLSSPEFIRQFSGMGKNLALKPPASKIRLVMSGEFEREKYRLRKILKKAGSSNPSRPLLHKLRVQAKRVRYGLEEFGFLMPQGGRELAARCKRLQDALGGRRDLELALERLKKVGNGLFPEPRPWMRELKTRRAARRKQFEKAVKSLRKTLC